MTQVYDVRVIILVRRLGVEEAKSRPALGLEFTSESEILTSKKLDLSHERLSNVLLNSLRSSL